MATQFGSPRADGAPLMLIGRHESVMGSYAPPSPSGRLLKAVPPQTNSSVPVHTAQAERRGDGASCSLIERKPLAHSPWRQSRSLGHGCPQSPQCIGSELVSTQRLSQHLNWHWEQSPASGGPSSSSCESSCESDVPSSEASALSEKASKDMLASASRSVAASLEPASALVTDLSSSSLATKSEQPKGATAPASMRTGMNARRIANLRSWGPWG